MRGAVTEGGGAGLRVFNNLSQHLYRPWRSQGVHWKPGEYPMERGMVRWNSDKAGTQEEPVQGKMNLTCLTFIKYIIRLFCLQIDQGFIQQSDSTS